MSIEPIDFWKAAQFHIQLTGLRNDLKLTDVYFSDLKSYINVYNSDHFHTIPMSSILFSDIKVAYLCYYRQFEGYINSHSEGLCKHIYDLNTQFYIEQGFLELNYPMLSCMNIRQKYIYSILINSVQNYVGAY